MTRRRRNRLIRRTLMVLLLLGSASAAWRWRDAWWPTVRAQFAEVQRKIEVAPARNPTPKPPPIDTPIRTAQKLWELRERRAYSEMANWIVPSRAKASTDLLAAVDTFLLAERQLRDYVRDEVGLGLRDAIDLSFFGEHLDIFSTNTELLDENIEGETARVAYWVNRKLPRRTAYFQRAADARWLYDPGEGDHPDLPRAFRSLAEGMKQTFADMKSGRIDSARVRQEPAYLATELATRLSPGLRLMPQPESRASHDDP